MTCRLSYILDIIGTNGLLCIRNPIVLRLFTSIKILFQSRNSGIDPKQRWIVVRNQACSWLNHMSLTFKVVQKHLTNLTSCQLFHICILLISIKKRSRIQERIVYAVPSQFTHVQNSTGTLTYSFNARYAQNSKAASILHHESSHLPLPLLNGYPNVLLFFIVLMNVIIITKSKRQCKSFIII